MSNEHVVINTHTQSYLWGVHHTVKLNDSFPKATMPHICTCSAITGECGIRL